MKTLEEQITELQDRLNKLENNLTEQSSEFEPCCVAECDCGCVEPETETDEGPEFDSAGFSEADRSEPEESTFTFTKTQLIEFTKLLMQRSLDATKEAMDNITLDNDDHVSLELSWNNTIEIELDGERIKKEIFDEIEDNISFNDDNVADEINDILSDMEFNG